VEFGHDNVRIGLADVHGCWCRSTRGTPYVRREQLTVDSRPDDAIAAASRLIEASLVETKLDTEHIIGVGIAVSASVDPDGVVRVDSGMPAWGGKQPMSELRSSLLTQSTESEWSRSCPFFVLNDANAAVLAEHWWGAAKGSSDVVALEWSHGLGAG